MSLTQHFDIGIKELDELRVLSEDSMPLRRSFVLSNNSISRGIRLRTDEISLKYFDASAFMWTLFLCVIKLNEIKYDNKY